MNEKCVGGEKSELKTVLGTSRHLYSLYSLYSVRRVLTEVRIPRFSVWLAAQLVQVSPSNR